MSTDRLHLASASYDRSGIALTPEIVKTVPVYLTKHVVLEKPVPVPEPVIIEEPYHVPLPIEKIVHKPVPMSQVTFRQFYFLSTALLTKSINNDIFFFYSNFVENNIKKSWKFLNIKIILISKHIKLF